MKRKALAFVGGTLILWSTMGAYAATVTDPLNDTTGLTAHKVQVEATTYMGKPSVHVTDLSELAGNYEDRLVILDESQLRNGTIEVELSGAPDARAAESARGFVGIAFRVDEGASSFEAIYLRPTNGRANDQLRRNHSTQYFSFPEYPWHRLREETPGLYETYVDLVPGEWTSVRIEIDGERALLYVHGAEHPTLIVNDLKLGERSGAIALWIGPGTAAYFSNLRVTTP